jgi:hypothetical protein
MQALPRRCHFPSLSPTICVGHSRECFTAVEWNPIDGLVQVPALWTGAQKTSDDPAVVGVDLGTDEAFTVLSLFRSDPGDLSLPPNRQVKAQLMQGGAQARRSTTSSASGATRTTTSSPPSPRRASGWTRSWSEARK